MNYDPGPPQSSSYDFNQVQSTQQQNFNQQFSQAEMRGGNDAGGLAIASMVIGIVGFFFYIGIIVPFLNYVICGITLIMGIAGIAMAGVAMKKISNSTDKSGFGFAITGLVLNIIQTLISLIGVSFMLIGLLFLASLTM